MFDPELLNKLSHQFIDNLPPAFKAMHQELDKTFRAVIHSVFTQMDLISREEFDAQTALLAENKAKLDFLQKEMQALSLKILDLEQLKNKTE